MFFARTTIIKIKIQPAASLITMCLTPNYTIEYQIHGITQWSFLTQPVRSSPFSEMLHTLEPLSSSKSTLTASSCEIYFLRPESCRWPSCLLSRKYAKWSTRLRKTQSTCSRSAPKSVAGNSVIDSEFIYR